MKQIPTKQSPRFTPATARAPKTYTRVATAPLAYSPRTTLAAVQVVVDYRRRPTVSTLVGVRRAGAATTAIEWLSSAISARILAETDVRAWLVTGFAPAANDPA